MGVALNCYIEAKHALFGGRRDACFQVDRAHSNIALCFCVEHDIKVTLVCTRVTKSGESFKSHQECKRSSGRICNFYICGIFSERLARFLVVVAVGFR